MLPVRPISTFLMNMQSRRMVANTQSEMHRAGTELATGLHADVHRELGSRSAQTISLRNLRSQNEEYVTSNKLLSNRLEIMADSLVRTREGISDAVNLAVQNKTSKTPTVGALRQTAEAALYEVVQSLNITMDGANIFSGINSEAKALTEMHEDIGGLGQTPMELLGSIIGGAPTDAADAAAKIADIDAFFDNANPPPGPNFEGSLYNGTPLIDGAGDPNPRVRAQLDGNGVVDYGIQANDDGFRNVLKGLYMMAAVDVSTIDDPDAYAAYMDHAVNAIDSGVRGVQDAESKLGAQQQMVDRVLNRQIDQDTILNNRILAFEHVDPYDAQVRVTMLETQLQATYNVTARMGQMSFTHWMR